MTSGVAFDEDHHVHSTFSDDAVSTLAQNIDAARRRGLRALCLADHQFPGDLGPVHPREMRYSIATGVVTAREVIDCLVDATAGALAMAARQLEPRPQLAHLFSILPKMGLDEGSTDSHDSRDVGAYARAPRMAGSAFSGAVP